MRGYQAITSTSIDGIKNGAPSDRCLSDADRCSLPLSTENKNDPPATWIASISRPFLTGNVGFIFLGVIIGCIGSGGFFSWGTVANSNNAPYTLGESAMRPSNSQHSFLVNGKSFLDSLPFEEVIPLSWNPAQARSHQEKTSNRSSSSSLDNISNALPTVKDLAASILGTSLASSPSSTPSGPHLLYHAHQSSFGLLYDSSKSSNYYLSEYSLDYFLINSGGFDAQVNQAYCAVATVATILNSLKYAKRFRDGEDLSGWSFDLPIDRRYDPYPYATQQDILEGECVFNTVIEHGDGTGKGEQGSRFDGIFTPPYGLTLEQSGNLLKCHTSNEWDVAVQEVDSSQLSLSRMRFELKAALIDPDARVMVNYDRKGLGQVGGGHFSPLGAYHASTDSFLIVDVAKYKYPPVWVGADTLYSAMGTVDKCGTWDFPKGQERLTDITTSDGKTTFINPITREDYAKSLSLLNCKQKMRGYIILKKKGRSLRTTVSDILK